MPCADQVVRQPVGAVLGAGEDQGVADVAALEEGDQQGRLELLGDRIHRLGDAHGRRRDAVDIHGRRVAQHLAGQDADRRRHGGAEEERLPAGRHVAQDAADIREKAHVEHPVGLVQHQMLEPGELRVGRPEVVQEPAGRADDDIHPAAERVLLRPDRDAAEDRRGAEGRMDREVVEVLEDLRRQLAGRGDDQGARRSARLVDQLVEDRQEKRRGLAAARDGAGQHVAPGHRRRDGVGLDGGRAGEAELFERFEESRMKVQTAEWHDRSFIFGLG